MSKKTNSINLRSLKNKNLNSNVIFEKYNYSKLLYQDFYIRDYLENILNYNFNNGISHKIIIQRKRDKLYIYLDYYLFKKNLRFYKSSNFKIFSIRRRFYWKKKKNMYKKYFDIRLHIKQNRINKYKKLFTKKIKPKKKKKKSFNNILLRLYNYNSFIVYSLKRLLILNLMLITGCKVHLYIRNTRRLLSLPSFIRERSYQKVKRDNVRNIMRNFRIRGYINNIKKLTVPVFIHLIYTSFIFQNPDLLGVFLSRVLKRNIKMFRFFYYFLLKTLRSLFMFSNLTGLKIQFKGRLGSSLRKRVSIIQLGQMPLQTINTNIRYSSIRSNTIYGICGIKIWYFYLTE
jgi:hypothetical protein